MTASAVTAGNARSKPLVVGSAKGSDPLRSDRAVIGRDGRAVVRPDRDRPLMRSLKGKDSTLVGILIVGTPRDNDGALVGMLRFGRLSDNDGKLVGVLMVVNPSNPDKDGRLGIVIAAVKGRDTVDGNLRAQGKQSG